MCEQCVKLCAQGSCVHGSCLSVCACVVSMVLNITLQAQFVLPPPFPAPLNPRLVLPDWMMWQGQIWMYCWSCEAWVPQAAGTAPILMTCQDCALLFAFAAAADLAEEEELELEAGDSE